MPTYKLSKEEKQYIDELIELSKQIPHLIKGAITVISKQQKLSNNCNYDYDAGVLTNIEDLK